MIRRAVVLVLCAVACDRQPLSAKDGTWSPSTTPITASALVAVDTNAVGSRWISEHSVRFSPASITRQDVERMTSEIADERVVMLGDSDDDIVESALVKLALVKYLHEVRGYNVLVMDAPVWECTPVLNPSLPYRADEMMSSCIAPNRRSEELRQLFEYVASTQNSARPLVLTGVAPEPLATTAATRRPASLASVVARYDVMVAQRVYSADSMLLRRMQLRRESLPLRPDSLFRRGSAEKFDSLQYWMDLRRGAADMTEIERARIGLVSIVMRSNATIVRMMPQPMPFMRSPDAMMARNVQFVADSLYPDQKMIVWSRNAIVHRGTPFTRLSGQPPTVAGIVGTQPSIKGVYTIGVYAASGSRRRSDGRIDTLSAGGEGSLEQLAMQSDGQSVLFSTRAQRGDTSAWWLSSRGMAVRDRRQWPLRTLSEEYDAVLVLSGTTPATGKVSAERVVCCVAWRP